MSEILPLFPLRTVLFPGGLLPLRIFEPRYIALVRDCMRDTHGFGVSPIRHGGEAGEPAEPHAVGTCAEIVDFDQGQDGLLHILVKGSYRFRLLSHQLAADQQLVGAIERIVDETSAALPIQYAQLKTVLQKILEIESASNGQTSAVPADAAQTVYRLLERLPFSLPQKLDILATASVDRQIELCSSALSQLMQKHGT